MFEPSRGGVKRSQPRAPHAERDVKIEQLLLTGLDHYFQGSYQRAVDVWTRVLLLDRDHARARACIDRARAALAERMRESEECLHTGAEAFERGDAAKARALLTAAIERGGGRDEALALLDRLDRLETAGGGAAGAEPGSAADPAPPDARGPAAGGAGAQRPVRVLPLVLLCGLLPACAWLLLSGDLLAPAGEAGPTRAAAASPAPARELLPLPAASEITLLRAERLVADGRPRAALALLALIDPDDPHSAEADALRTAVQRDLLAAADASPRPAPPAR